MRRAVPLSEDAPDTLAPDTVDGIDLPAAIHAARALLAALGILGGDPGGPGSGHPADLLDAAGISVPRTSPPQPARCAPTDTRDERRKGIVVTMVIVKKRVADRRRTQDRFGRTARGPTLSIHRARTRTRRGEVSEMAGAPRILIVGGGCGGMHVALRLAHSLRRGEARVTVVDPRSYLTYQPLLAEAAAGSLEPRHVVVPLRQVLPRTRVVTRAVASIDHTRRVARLEPADCGRALPEFLEYDVLVLAPGSVTRVLPVPGLAESGIGFKTVGEAIHLRNHVLARLDAAAVIPAGPHRRALLTFVFVGGGYAGVEALAELEDMARAACRHYPEIEPAELRWILVEAADRILPEVGARMGRYTAELLRTRGIDVRLNTRLLSALGGHLVLDDGEQFDAGTLVWTAGVAPHPLVKQTGLPLDAHGRVVATECLSVADTQDAWALGDCAAVPDLAGTPGALCAPSAQHAVRQARVLADNVIAVLRGGAPKPYRHPHAGSVASLGLYQGVAQIFGIRLHGLPAWFIHRTYHLAKLPTLNRRLRVLADWTLALAFPREIVSLGALEHARGDFEAAAASVPAAD